MKEVIMFKCDHCTKKYASKYRTRDHEKECWKNPKTKSCNTCYWNEYEGRERRCTWAPEHHHLPHTFPHQFHDSYPQIPVMHCESWTPSYSYQEEE